MNRAVDKASKRSAADAGDRLREDAVQRDDAHAAALRRDRQLANESRQTLVAMHAEEVDRLRAVHAETLQTQQRRLKAAVETERAAADAALTAARDDHVLAEKRLEAAKDAAERRCAALQQELDSVRDQARGEVPGVTTAAAGAGAGAGAGTRPKRDDDFDDDDELFLESHIQDLQLALQDVVASPVSQAASPPQAARPPKPAVETVSTAVGTDMSGEDLLELHAQLTAARRQHASNSSMWQTTAQADAARVTAANAASDVAEARAAALHQEAEALRGQVMALTARLEQEKQVTPTKVQAELTRVKSALVAQKDAAIAAHKTRQREQQQAAAAAAQAKSELSALQRRHEELKTTSTQLLRDHDALKVQLQDTVAACDAMRRNFRQQTDVYHEALQLERSALEASRAEAQEETDGFTGEAEALRGVIAALQSKVEASANRESLLRAKLASTADELAVQLAVRDQMAASLQQYVEQGVMAAVDRSAVTSAEAAVQTHAELSPAAAAVDAATPAVSDVVNHRSDVLQLTLQLQHAEAALGDSRQDVVDLEAAVARHAKQGQRVAEESAAAGARAQAAEEDARCAWDRVEELEGHLVTAQAHMRGVTHHVAALRAQASVELEEKEAEARGLRESGHRALEAVQDVLQLAQRSLAVSAVSQHQAARAAVTTAGSVFGGRL